MMPFKRLKTLCFAIFTALSLGAAFTTFPLGTPASHAAGTTQLSLAQQIDINGRPLANCQLTFFVAGTVGTLQQVFGDFGLTTPIANPLSCDQAGRVPQHWLADGLIHIRLTDSFGLQVVDTTTQVLGPSSGGGGGGGTVDPTAILATGDVKSRYGTGPLSGFVRLNGLTIGSATSGASERANADTQALWIYLYGVDANLVVSGGRTGNALNDFNANKTIATPDFRSRALAGLGDMGNSDNALFSGVTFTRGNSTTLGSLLGAARLALALASIPSIVSPLSVTSSSSGVVTATIASSNFSFGNGGSVQSGTLLGAGGASGTQTSTGTATSTGTFGSAFDSVSPYGLVTLYLKL